MQKYKPTNNTNLLGNDLKKLMPMKQIIDNLPEKSTKPLT